jgi:hypothetical protein
MEEKDLLIFGQDLGDGSKNSHLRLGFTSMKLIKLINKFGNKGVWHIDATYKIIKYCYPLIVKKLFQIVNPVVEIVHEKRRGRTTLAEAVLKLDKLQEIEKLKPVVVRRTSNRNSKKL